MNSVRALLGEIHRSEQWLHFLKYFLSSNRIWPYNWIFKISVLFCQIINLNSTHQSSLFAGEGVFSCSSWKDPDVVWFSFFQGLGTKFLSQKKLQKCQPFVILDDLCLLTSNWNDYEWTTFKRKLSKFILLNNMFILPSFSSKALGHNTSI